MEKIYTLDEVSNLLSASRQTVYKLVRSGEIGAFKQGRVWRIPESSVEAYVLKKMKETESK